MGIYVFLGGVKRFCMAFFGLNGDLWCFFGVKRFCRFFFVFIWGFPIFELIFMGF